MTKRTGNLTKFLDRYLGIPLIYILGLFKIKNQYQVV